MKMKLIKSNNAVSKVVGVALLLAITISIFSLLAFVVLSYPFTPSQPSVNLVGYIMDNNIIIEHYGGESLDDKTVVIIRINETITKINITDTDFDENDNGFWDLGEKFRYFIGNNMGEQIEVTVVDIWSNSIIMNGIIQEGKL